ncbi:maleylpyruvate isomerase family mycothiol-dependent enzyme [Asanoa sp. WMMD1127]|uniref:maleylpyruvate isomerase family mycothiol-dependent enzyme n=1 Tax=Asanoa sp. WMMD1127 TaxID=3016107 RepID=UPI0024163C45|nr:maleylpyruvate isomerase family mycothiol-dependent enzyme [Asanoa sp. WMMD1127]MDG4821515.1 maleylpyruvate isomerase family mycothiol-dependent enzyme [Asanoa sp. WMMD1127]
MTRDVFLRSLEADFADLRAAAVDLSAPVPSCPGWTVDALVDHVAHVYLHKVETMRLGKLPEAWPPEPTGEKSLALLDRAHAELVAEFAERPDDQPCPTWYEPDQTVGFWVRRMAQETVIHRVDAELAAGFPISPIPAELADDGIAEVLEVFLSYATRNWPEDFGDLLRADGNKSVLVSAGGARWLVRLHHGSVDIAPDTAGQAVAQVSGAPHDVLLWLWRRLGDNAVRVDGDAAAVARLRALLEAATQ